MSVSKLSRCIWAEPRAIAPVSNPSHSCIVRFQICATCRTQTHTVTCWSESLRHYKDAPFWEIRHRAKKIKLFRNDLKVFFSNAQAADEKAEARSRINLALQEVGEMVRAAGVSPLVGGNPSDFDALANIFRLTLWRYSPQIAVDFVERALGVYAAETKRSIFRTVNPFWWGLNLLGWVARLPFVVLGSAGFNTSSFEQSKRGSFFKLLMEGLFVITAVLTTLNLLGLLEAAKSWAGI